jgi:exopolysaccharide biosynthesis predicted pyruvyltransferase EpsI
MSEWITQAHRAQLALMQQTLLTTLSRSLKGATECALIDFPDHPNVGDSMIWLGELEALRQLGVRLKYVCTDQSYDPVALRHCLNERTAILIHGGGNFGTLYVRHQRLRERVLEDFPRQRTIQMSQSINFQRADALEQMQRIIARHRDFHFLVRDKRSLDFASLNFDCTMDLCPDFALLMGPQASQQRPRADYFVLARTDKEKGTDWSEAVAARPNATIIQGDWLKADPFEARLSAGTQLARRAAKKL